MDRLDAMAMFVAVVDAGSLAGAARRLGRSPASVTRAVALLEARSGERLLHRSTRRLRLTEAGERLAATYRSVLAELAEAEEEGAGQGSREGGGEAAGLAGTLGLTAPELFGRQAVMPVVEAFLAGHPEAHARVLLLDRVVDLVEEGIDVAVRLAPLPESGMHAVRLGAVRNLVCAAPAYLARHGAPDAPADLRHHRCLGRSTANPRELWRFDRPGPPRGRALPVAVHPRIALNGTGASIDAALRGSGVCRALSYQVAEHVAAGRLVPLLAAFEPAPVPVSLVFHPIPRRNRLLRAFVDHATPRLRAALAATAALM